MQHYYTNNPISNKNEKIIYGIIKGEKYKFLTDNGVFSKKFIDFGTKTLLESFHTERKKLEICDLGCGYGVVSVFLANNYEDFSFTMIDINKRCLELSKKNIELNKIKSKIEIIENNVLDQISKKFDIILTNPPIRAGKNVVFKIMEQSYHSLNEGGELWVVIQKKQGMSSVKKLLEKIFNSVIIVKKNKGYYVLKSLKN
ncbi:class I SAM-dependent methyltransferase [Gemelliphila asaccharolytica]|uniref:Methyltransferase small domain protein n=1 Tax=Gemelliphila asaccharolytica TaxID=502393 RepID=A0ABR5TMC7_9BACL|nr:methyltransferase [Gemella asaccharolytica]KXB58442.1 methyltransferase small domain protein [Gemella asaccharolytica]